MSDPNGIARGQAHREQIRALMIEHVRRYPLARPLTGNQIAKHVDLKLSCIYTYMAQIRREMAAAAPAIAAPSEHRNNSDIHLA